MDTKKYFLNWIWFPRNNISNSAKMVHQAQVQRRSLGLVPWGWGALPGRGRPGLQHWEQDIPSQEEKTILTGLQLAPINFQRTEACLALCVNPASEQYGNFKPVSCSFCFLWMVTVISLFFVLSYLWHVLIALKGRAYHVFFAQIMYVQ